MTTQQTAMRIKADDSPTTADIRRLQEVIDQKNAEIRGLRTLLREAKHRHDKRR